MKFWKNKKLVFGAVIIIFIATLMPQVVEVQASLGEAFNVVGGFALSPITATMSGLFYVIKYILAGVITLSALLITTAIDFGNNVLNIPAVQEGWRIMVDFTNLGFVLGIIIIAFATILHLENYAIKQTLAKLIIAALLVNFSLMISGAIISISKLTTDIFYNHITINGEKSMGDVLGSLAQPQKLAKPSGEKEGFFKELWKDVKEATSALTATGALKIILGLFFQLATDFIIILTFLTLFLMLLVRAIALIFLLILSPIVWLLWIFPATKKYFQQWWQEFIRWNFFTPAIMFFMYLSVLTQNKIGQLMINKQKTNMEKALSGATTLPKDGWEVILNNMVIMALLVGGLYVANKFSIAGGNIGMNLAKKAGKGVGKGVGMWTLRKGIDLGTRPLRGKWGQKITEKMQEEGLKYGRFGRFVTSPIRRLGNITADLGTRQGRKLVAQAEKRNEKYSDKELAARFSTLSRDEQMAAIKRFTKNGTTDLMDKRDINHFLGNKTITGKAQAEEMFKMYGEEKAYKDFIKKIGVSHKMAAAKTKKEREDAAKEHFMSYKDEDWKNIDTSILTDEEYGDLAMKNLIKYSPASLSKIMPKIGGIDKKTGKRNIDIVKEKIINMEKEVNDEIIRNYNTASRNIINELDNIIQTIQPGINIGYSGLMDIDKKLKWIQEKDKNKFNELDDNIKTILSRKKSIQRNLASSITGLGWFDELE